MTHAWSDGPAPSPSGDFSSPAPAACDGGDTGDGVAGGRSDSDQTASIRLATRHAAATFLLPQGMTLEDVKSQLGHSSIVLISTTYGHVLEQRQRQVARAMDAALGG